MDQGGCTEDTFTGYTTDDRYTSSGLNATVFGMQYAYGVSDILSNSPGYYTNFTSDRYG